MAKGKKTTKRYVRVSLCPRCHTVGKKTPLRLYSCVESHIHGPVMHCPLCYWFAYL